MCVCVVRVFRLHTAPQRPRAGLLLHNFYLFTVFLARAEQVKYPAKIMKANEFVKLSNVRESLKKAKTPCAIVKTLYVFAEQQGAESLAAILPKSKNDACALIPAVCELYNVGTAKECTKKDGTKAQRIIRFSADMFLRFLCAKQNEGAKAIEKAAKAAKKAKEDKARAEKKAKEQAEKEERKAKREEERKAKKAAKEAEKAVKAAKKAEEQKKREETAQKHVQVMKARTQEQKKERKGNKKGNK